MSEIQNTVTLSDGRVVELREQKGSDEIVVAGQLGDLFTMDGAGAMIFQNFLIVSTITSIDGKPIEKKRNFEDVRDFLDTFKAKDWNKVKALHTKLNGDDEGNAKK